ncbi:hypothetical protein F511_39457 [Dorcoceras hygrometricum]|uniref:Uncharacterized protein n=1 Tax=Dorcoceras hygrometricum TaxID=472368 RepID=A0A2Z7D9W8_9LAMI|nr:hypothetical protein F511_39457 [Dorcoceras hygrometricum]
MGSQLRVVQDVLSLIQLRGELDVPKPVSALSSTLVGGYCISDHGNGSCTYLHFDQVLVISRDIDIFFHFEILSCYPVTKRFATVHRTLSSPIAGVSNSA